MKTVLEVPQTRETEVVSKAKRRGIVVSSEDATEAERSCDLLNASKAGQQRQ